MDNSQKREILNILTNELNVLAEQAGQKDFTVENYADEGDVASQLTRQNLDAVIQRRCSSRLKELEIAMRRIRNDAYGVCEECGDDISVARLKANPSARLCVVCQSQIEDGFAQ